MPSLIYISRGLLTIYRSGVRGVKTRKTYERRDFAIAMTFKVHPYLDWHTQQDNSLAKSNTANFISRLIGRSLIWLGICS